MPDLTPDSSPFSPQAPTGHHIPDTRRRIGDITSTRKWIYDNVQKSATAIEPIANSRHTLSLHDVNYDNLDDFTLAKQKETILAGRSLSHRLKGTWRLTDNATNKVIDEKPVTIANVPHLTNRGTFIMNGTEFVLSSQLRLRPGIYSRQKSNGELEAHVNVAGRGASHRYFLDPETGIFRIHIGQADIPLLPLLRSLGATDRELKKHWGDLLPVNQKHDSPHYLDKLHDRIVRRSDPNAPPEAKREALAKAIQSMELDPEVTKRTLGKPYSNLSKEAILDTTSKLLSLNRGEASPDDRDHLAFQTVMGPEDLMAERIGRDRTSLQRLLWQSSFRGNLSHVQPGVFNRSIMAGFLGSGLATTPEGINSSEFTDHMGRLTRMGEGGLGKGSEGIPSESRAVHPSHLGFIDLAKVPEGGTVGVDLRMAFGVQKGTDNRLYAPFRDAKSNRLVYRSPQDISNLTVSFPGELDKGKNHVAAISDGRMRYVPRNKVDLEVPSMENAFSPLTNMIPMKSAAKAQRVSMGSRMISQALPLVNPEAPYVRTAVPGQAGKSYEELFGRHMGAVIADQAGRVEKLTPDSVTMRYADGTRVTHDLYSHWPGPRKTGIHNEPLVRIGETVKAGQVLAKSNFTNEKGEAALGKNARIAYIPVGGKVYEDSALISESFAKNLTSEHYYQHPTDFDESIKKGKKNFIGLFPGKFEKKILANLDDDGIVKPGTIVNSGDPLVLMAKHRELTHGKITSSARSAFSDQTLKWDHHNPGVVTDIMPSRNGVNVVVKSIAPMQIGDKLSNRHGGKSTVADILPDHKMPHDESGQPFDMAWSPLSLLSRINPAWVAESALGKVAAKVGKHYAIEDFGKIPNITKFAMDELAKHGLSDTETVTDPLTGRKIPEVLTGNNFIMKLHHTSECFDDQTEVLTLDGWKKWADTITSDKLATIENGRLIYEQPLDIVRLPFHGELYCYSGKYIDYAVTGNHRLYLKYYYQKNFKYELAETAHGRRFAVPQFGFIPDVQECSINFQLGDYALDWGDYAELVGWWASEGYAKVTKRSAYTVIYQSYEANPHHFATIEALVNRLPFKWSYYRSRGKKLGIIISNRVLATHLRSFGTKSINKRLPRHLLNGPVAARQRAFTALMSGDGSTNNDSAGYTTVSKGLADDFQELCIRCGSGAIVSLVSARIGPQYVPAINSNGETYKRQVKHLSQAYHIGVALQRTLAQVDGDRHPEQFSIIDYDGMVYCATMRTGLLYVRRNGKPMVSGNSKSQGRGLGSYSAEGAPARGATGSAKRISLGDTNALLAHGATAVLRDVKETRGQSSPEFWLAYMSGFPTPHSKIPAVYDKFVNDLKGSGINVVREGPRLRLMALTNNDIKELAGNREIQNAETVHFDRGLKPVKGGLFDEGITGGHGGTSWSQIPLVEPMPNPAFSDPIKKLLGLTEKKFTGILAGSEELNGIRGPEALSKALSSINVKQELERAHKDMESGRKGAYDSAVRRLQYLKALDKTGQHPKDWMLNSVPVLPPTFRPVSLMAGGRGQLISDPNYLYKELFDANENLKGLKGRVSDVGTERLSVYRAFEGITGLGDPTHPKNVERGVKGILKNIFGSSPKYSVIQQKLLGSTVDLAGRAVIIPDPDLDMDHIGIPATKAFDVYRPFVVRELVRRGVPRVQALKDVEDKGELAKGALLDIMKDRPVLVNRYPLLHRYGLMAFYPKLTSGDTIRVSPIVTKGFGADFDGDAMQFHVPVAEDAVNDARDKMLPSKNLYSAATMKATSYLPNMEYVQGLHAASVAKDESRRPRVFATQQDAVAAFRRGEIGLGQKVEIVQ